MEIYDEILNMVDLRVPNRTDIEKAKIEKLKKDDRLYGISPICIEILFNRGLKTVEDIERHLYSTIKDTHSPALLKDSDKFIIRVIEAIENKETIIIYGDYDVDGITSVSIAYLALTNAEAIVNHYTNNRFIEGYGITPKGVEMLKDKFPEASLIITTDNGIVGFNGVKRANELGIDVLITDHHDPSEDGILPEAIAVVDPKRKDCPYPFKGLCGAGVIFKLMLQLYFELNLDINYVYELLDILALATVADLVPLLDENRVFVKEGIKLVKEEKRLAFTKLREALELSKIDEETFGFQYGPMINALGRIDGCVDDAIELFISNDELRLEEIVKTLIEKNDYRKEITTEQELLGIQMVEAMPVVPNVIVLYDNTFHEGIVGLVAGRLKETFNRPTIILAPHEHEILQPDGTILTQIIYKGSARSIEGLNIKETFYKLKKYLISFGGHYMAGGMSIMPEQLDAFISAINKEAGKTLTNEHYSKKIVIDAPLKSCEITKDLIQDIELLKPFGMNFSKPRFGLSQFVLNPSKNSEVCIGKDKNTLKLVSEDNLTLIMFKYAERYKEINCPVRVKAVGYPVLNMFNGNSYPQFRVENNYIFNPMAKKPPKEKSS